MVVAVVMVIMTVFCFILVTEYITLFDRYLSSFSLFVRYV